MKKDGIETGVWRGKIAFPEHYVDKLIEKNKDVQITDKVSGKKNTYSIEELSNPLFKGKDIFKDEYEKGKTYQLLYYNWK